MNADLDRAIDNLTKDIRALLDIAYRQGVADENARILANIADLRLSGDGSRTRRPPASVEEGGRTAAANDKEALAPVDAATLPPLTERQAKVFKAVVSAAAKSHGRNRALGAAIKTHSGFANVEDALVALRSKGYIRRAHESDGVSCYPLAVGEPKIEEAASAHRWSDQECEELVREMFACHGDDRQPNWRKLGELFNRTPQAVESQARKQRWYPGAPQGVYADQFKPEPLADEDEEVGRSEEQPRAVVSVHEPEAAEVGESEHQDVDIDDLSKAPREVLAIIFELHADKLHPIKEPDISNLMELDGGRLPAILTRLSELNLIRRDGVGSWFPTRRGQEIAAEIKADEAVA